jgi:MoaA/NifB/PqqE/SkfB family radical SAM enzyme
MSRRQQLRLAGRFLRHRFRAVHPFEVQAVLLNACNLQCSYCLCPEIKTRLMTTEQWLEVIAYLGSVGTMRLKFQGGEPTLRTDFRTLCAAVQQAGILCAVITNGTRIAEDPSLLDHLDEVVFSCDAVDPATNDAVRGEGSHALIMRAIEVAQRAEHRPRLFINMVVMRHNLAQMEPMLRFCEERGIGLNAQPAVFGLPYYNDAAKPLALDNEETRAMFEMLAQWKRQGRGLMFAATSYEHAVAWPDYRRARQRRAAGAHCASVGRVYIHIEANGDVQPCVQTGGTFRAKNLYGDGFEEALAHVQGHDCGDCYSAYLTERKALFGLRPAAVVEYLRRS